MQSFTMRPATGNGPFSWHRAISSSEKRAFWSYRVGYLLDAMDSQFLSFVIPTLIATWGITRRCRVDRDAVTLFDLPGRRMGCGSAVGPYRAGPATACVEQGHPSRPREPRPVDTADRLLQESLPPCTSSCH